MGNDSIYKGFSATYQVFLSLAAFAETIPIKEWHNSYYVGFLFRKNGTVWKMEESWERVEGKGFASWTFAVPRTGICIAIILQCFFHPLVLRMKCKELFWC